jgi:hypothetical protein
MLKIPLMVTVFFLDKWLSLFICDKIPNVDMRYARIVKTKHLEIKPLETPKPNGSQENSW